MDGVTKDKAIMLGIVAAVIAAALAFGVDLERLGAAMLWLRENFGMGS